MVFENRKASEKSAAEEIQVVKIHVRDRTAPEKLSEVKPPERRLSTTGLRIGSS
jgi:hypothetical protein